MDDATPLSPGQRFETLPTPKFIYFDLGNVLLKFDHQRAARQIGELTGLTPQAAWDVVFADDLELRYERGEISTAEFHASFCRHSQTSPALAALANAASDIFEPNRPVIGLLTQLQRNGHRLGLLSNTNEAHWTFITKQFPDLPICFEVIALSFEMQLLKPEPEIYLAAARKAECKPDEILFIDDRADNVSGAVATGMDAVQFTTDRQLVADLIARGLGPLE